MKLRIGLLIVLCLLCLLNFKVQWDRYEKACSQRSAWLTIEKNGRCVTFVWSDPNHSPERGDSWTGCYKE